jgi:hypothetical protein
MRVLVIRNRNGQVAGAVIGPISTVDGVLAVRGVQPSGLHATILPGPGQTFEEVDLPDSMQQFVGTDPVSFQRQLHAHVPNR